ncbi:PREDICTED: LOW QUALITY PROTEIN: DNA polymerase subunit gamma-2, mitochondrial [Nanorana parkeri]|uniref:LOW QUALITY PROTEIN: DNA polymerase subunit gamma-2, mitochondrial n=1 Tax=Nanorana parkeri TaxID=125878 RepID=UPI000854EB64|nr:PREDICTED: LOW QUALITY PROTEIN: DNA polymerase subunit gamma-2, mitochondrial [Nanorana parkeri]
MSWCAVGVARRTRRSFAASPLLQCRRLAAGEQTHGDLLDLCRRRNFLLGGQTTPPSVLGGGHGLGPLGAQMKRNLLQKWWEATALRRDQVLPIDSLCHRPGTSDPPSPRPTIRTAPKSWLDRNTTREELEKMADLRQDLLHGALYNYLPCLELLNRKLPFGIAEVGRCFRPITDFAQVPSRFSVADHHDDAGRKISIIRYDFPWGEEPIERISSMDDSALTQVHHGPINSLQGRDGRKSVVPHAVWLSSDVERGLLAYLSDAMQVMESPAPQDQRRTVLKIHPLLTPVKVAVDMGRGRAAELRLVCTRFQVCEGLCGELRGCGISVWPGYLETLQTRMEQLYTKYDEMGVLFTALVSDATLESGLIQLRSRDTTIKDTMHVSKLSAFLTQHMTAADNL